MKALTMPAARSRKKIVILSGLDIERKYSAHHFAGSGKMVANVGKMFAHVAKAAFSPAFSVAVGAAATLAMLWHMASIADAAAAGEAVAADCMAAMPWLAYWCFKGYAADCSEEGGES